MTGARVVFLSAGFVAIVSERDFLRVVRHKWHVHRSRGSKKKPGQPYARANIKGKKVYLHRFITGAADYLQVDHKNHQTLDCRRENLEVCDNITNQQRRRNVKIIHKKKDDRQTALDLGQGVGNNPASI